MAPVFEYESIRKVPKGVKGLISRKKIRCLFNPGGAIIARNGEETEMIVGIDNIPGELIREADQSSEVELHMLSGAYNSERCTKRQENFVLNRRFGERYAGNSGFRGNSRTAHRCNLSDAQSRFEAYQRSGLLGKKGRKRRRAKRK